MPTTPGRLWSPARRHLEHYGRTAFGRFDLFVVIATAPWFLFPGAQQADSWSCSAWPASPGW
jgi:hypothetical protein